MEEQAPPKRKYKVVSLVRDVRVMSSGHMWLECRVSGRPRGKNLVDFDPHYREFYRWANAPKYLINEVMEQAREAYASDGLRFYECNQEEQRRYTNLRYFDAEEAARLFGPRQEQPTPAAES